MSKRIVGKKRFGQHFLVDTIYSKKIVQSMIKDDLELIEIGPGLGDLTKELLKEDSVVAYEIDIDACEFLKNNFKDYLDKNQLTLIEGDVLRVWNSRNLRQKPYRIVANLPYNVGTEIILRALRDDYCKEIIVMVQKEVAEKFCGKVNQKNFSSLRVLTESIGEAQMLFNVPPSAFEPPPKVDSAVFKIVKNAPFYDEELSQFLKCAFVAPRKRLIKNLSTKYNKDLLETVFNDFNFPSTIRAHQVSTKDFLELFSALKK